MPAIVTSNSLDASLPPTLDSAKEADDVKAADGGAA